MAMRVLDGVGDARLGQWEEQHQAFHVRRRLSDLEIGNVGPVVDIRGTVEASTRAAALGSMLRLVPADVLAEELGA